MALTYEDSVWEAADLYEDNHDVSWVALDERNAGALLSWLGY